MIRRFLLIAAWAALGCIILVTLAPIGMRPIVSNEAGYERFLAYAVLGFLLWHAHPRRLLFVSAIIVVSATSLEALQHLTPDRHGHWSDLSEKLSGGLFGLFAAHLICFIFTRLFAR
jgi:hypothetical protein